ncbi:PTS sorbitol transporter subunit IIC [Neobacillus sp. MM2021_6]|uniref:PTS glucitol/sorbitol transporter subunit IIC n=1 Tax=Bacillaceae TaxID=186817 RepID=UPI0014093D0F|nr:MULTISPECIES: PTS glucitol/sorbitol transporter subunit IIC [Bacillaceae]MBO0958669.1 PTS sorbitol transporter subunit IIC [Neobacillus sp. MM2021_6]NHC20191.1 PTS sorbitol transporter subunit IIC [Bacillus sp. MM2020_4]
MDWKTFLGSGPTKEIVEVFLSLLMTTGPYLLVALAINSFISKLIRKEWLNFIAAKFGHIALVRYTLLPFLSLFALTNPSCYEVGSHLNEKHKPAFYDATVSFCHPITSILPFSNSGELFFLIAPLYPIMKLNLSLGNFMIAYFVGGLVIVFMKGVTTELLTRHYMSKIQ